MPFYLCEEHHLAAKTWWGMRGHWNLKHPGQPPPEKASIEVEEIPEGYSTSKWSGGEKPAAEQPGTGPVIEDLGELPRDPVDLFSTLLKLKGLTSDRVTSLTREFRLSSWMWNDAQEISTLLRAHLKSQATTEWIHTFLKQYGSTVEMPSEAGVEFLGGRRGAGERFFGSLGGQGETSTDRLVTYLITREDRQRRDREREPQGLDPVTEQRMQNMETMMGQIMDSVVKKQEEDKLEQRFAKMDAKLERPQGQGQSDFLKEYLAERDKRVEGLMEQQNKIIENLGQRLQESAKEVARAKDAVTAARADAISEEESRRARYREEMEASGWTGRERSKEERQYDLVSQILPLADRRLGRMQESVDKLVTGGGPRPPEPAPGSGRKPVSPDEAARLARVMEIEERMRAGS